MNCALDHGDSGEKSEATALSAPCPCDGLREVILHERWCEVFGTGDYGCSCGAAYGNATRFIDLVNSLRAELARLNREIDEDSTVIALRSDIAQWEAESKRLRAEVVALEAALRDIRDLPHVQEGRTLSDSALLDRAKGRAYAALKEGK